MRIQFIITQEEVAAAKAKHKELKQAARLSKSVGEKEDAREFYFRAKGFEEALIMFGIYKEKEDK